MSAARPALIAAVFAAAAAVAVRFHTRPPTRQDATHVVAVRAGGGDVPSNLLRVYVELSAAMEPGSAYEHIHIVDAEGHEVRDAFLELREELWSPDHRRLTLLFDPGRVKRGIRSNLEMGAPLVAGHRYRLVVDSGWRDAMNQPLAASYTQELRVAGLDSLPPNPSRWAISAPRRDSRDTLRVGFGEPLDHALALRLITVVDERGSRIPGLASLSDDDRRWTFLPSAAWPRQALLRIEPALEDLAGNNIVRLFDADRSGELGSDSPLTDTTPRFISVIRS
ncbi:MAG TPA: hypothetical protein VJO33_15610 [Gemmatimonadaceae bacterium]|nr:hypothetical protein [Gemmatimonadaceae bacterium]